MSLKRIFIYWDSSRDSKAMSDVVGILERLAVGTRALSLLQGWERKDKGPRVDILFF